MVLNHVILKFRVSYVSDGSFRFVRLHQIGIGSNNTHRLIFYSFELFGTTRPIDSPLKCPDKVCSFADARENDAAL